VEGKKMEIELFDTHDDNEDINIAETLVKENLAAWVSSSSVKEQRPKPTQKTLAGLELLKVSSGDILYITAVDSPERMYCQLAGTEEKLDCLMSSLASFYGSSEARELSVQAISVGQVCAAFTQDKAWYRAVVEKVSSDNITVRFIDYGNTETLSLSNIRLLAEEFVKENVLSVTCKLSGVRPSGGAAEWPREATEFLENVGDEEGFKVKEISSGKVIEVKLCDREGDLGDRLVKKGLAMTNQQEPTKPVNQTKPPSPKRGSKECFQSPDIKVGTKVEIYVTDIT
jgi:tudor domain-containing protein 1/4/6/7